MTVAEDIHVGPFPVAPVIQRLVDLVPELKLVSQAADLRTALEQQPPATPAAYVVRSERAKQSAGASGGLLVQEMQVTVVIVLYVRNHATGATGAAAAAEMDSLVARSRRALLNWSPDPALDPLSHNGSRDDNFKASTLAVQEFFQSRYRIQVNRNE